ncbi:MULTISPECIES: DUF421 domain-containing protein [Bacillus cereus group]|uniref:DUF421 domain-containing protein n=1 Tax=Bacillus cereus TaxID=1396 RepID=A0A9W7QAX0_BACCE|nr:DUF421 domain-containing protein [Bacillus cereus]KAB2388944.1 DUF421 domain-containing protein [Bacillus cereus]KAB2406388.1 DUF421 domain-containing protein [Bacillus cereus]KAB2427398.1 DUF421 domain-containing protein [Bacillus cereus]KAB2449475.1 DUF421 domain-containing protein [Bacillus cereus]KAB2485550.1 DUF421 domain-containing protein [Bacillus cereus]
MNFILEAFILILSGILLLRLAGRKSISQMTLAQTVVMISIGTIIVQPIVEKSVLKAIVSALIFVISVVILEYLQLKSNAFEKFITGKSKTVIENGILNVIALKKMRLTVDQLEMRLRNQGISKIEDVKTATLEPNGQLGYELKGDAKPLTVGDLKKLIQPQFLNQNMMSNNLKDLQEKNNNSNIFQEINAHSHQEHHDLK